MENLSYKLFKKPITHQSVNTVKWTIHRLGRLQTFNYEKQFNILKKKKTFRLVSQNISIIFYFQPQRVESWGEGKGKQVGLSKLEKKNVQIIFTFLSFLFLYLSFLLQETRFTPPPFLPHFFGTFLISIFQKFYSINMQTSNIIKNILKEKKSQQSVD